MFSLKAQQSENKIISVLKLSCNDDFNQAKFNKYNVHVQPIAIFKISYTLLEQSTDQADVLSSAELMDTDGRQDKEVQV
jgi:hypothetical protein